MLSAPGNGIPKFGNIGCLTVFSRYWPAVIGMGMAKEIELKLALSQHHVEVLKQQPLFLSDKVSVLGNRPLKNIYFDTPDQLLSRNKVALRIRTKEGAFIQTLKTQGSSEGGLHQRNEWEWEVKAPELDFDLLKQVELPLSLDLAELEQHIEPIFATDFMRHLWLLDDVDADGNPLQVEMALDIGEVWFNHESGDGRRADPLCELELELKTGEPAALFGVALQLANQVPLQICDISKAERGYRLRGDGDWQRPVAPVELHPEETLEMAFARLIQHELMQWPRYLEAWQFSGDWSYIPKALESLRNMGAVYESFSDIIPYESSVELDEQLTKVIRKMRDIDAWRRAGELMGDAGRAWCQSAQAKAEPRMEVLLQTREPGVIALTVASQLVTAGWRKHWKDAHQQRAEQPLASA